ncbi:MAG: DinB family protein [Anaerolineales bacterium]|nr:DinB family protein [Chloroflexota bacterium]MBL6980492.1 DinB family protein [Anaerolineales bacterium]
MKQSDSLTTLFSHNKWANLHLLERCSALSGEQLEATIPGAFGSIRGTLLHIVTSEQAYFTRISTGQPRADSDDDMLIADMIKAVHETGTGLIEWATKVQADDTVELNWSGTPREVPKTVILTQVINHATEHRAQIMTILTQIGIEPPNLDSWTYFDEMDKNQL